MATRINNKFNKWLQFELDQRDWSYRDLAERSGPSHSMTGHVFTGRRLPTWDYCVKLAHAFGYSPIPIFVLAGLLTRTDLKGIIITEKAKLNSR